MNDELMDWLHDHQEATKAGDKEEAQYAMTQIKRLVAALNMQDTQAAQNPDPSLAGAFFSGLGGDAYAPVDNGGQLLNAAGTQSREQAQRLQDVSEQHHPIARALGELTPDVIMSLGSLAQLPSLAKQLGALKEPAKQFLGLPKWLGGGGREALETASGQLGPSAKIANALPSAGWQERALARQGFTPEISQRILAQPPTSAVPPARNALELASQGRGTPTPAQQAVRAESEIMSVPQPGMGRPAAAYDIPPVAPEALPAETMQLIQQAFATKMKGSIVEMPDFARALREVEKTIGRKLTMQERGQLHGFTESGNLQ